MKKIVLKITHLAVFLVILFSIKNIVSANSISSINMDIYVDNNGNAEVTEVWSCYTNQGTECYHPYYSLGNSRITNLRVSDNKGRSYEQVSSWDTDDTMSQKAYKCGINNIYNGVELCWGISNYGSNVYTVKYNISNFVSELTDSQMMYWTLVPYDFSNTIGSVKIPSSIIFAVSFFILKRPQATIKPTKKVIKIDTLAVFIEMKIGDQSVMSKLLKKLVIQMNKLILNYYFLTLLVIQMNNI